MSQSLKLQRWIDLVSALLARTQGATLAELVHLVPGYRTATKSTSRRMFERDKDELRRLGVPIETAGDEGAADTRYLIAPGKFYLPYLSVATARGRRAVRRIDRYGYRALGECEFTDQDLALLADAATRVISFGDPVLTNDAQLALRRLLVDLPSSELHPTPATSVQLAAPRANDATLASLGDALLRRKQVRFTYYGIERHETEHRTVLPYGLAFTSGHWYLHALDPSRGAVRRFRVSRIQGVETNPKSPGTEDFAIPASFRLHERAISVPPWQLGEESPEKVRVRFQGANGLIRAARRLGTSTSPEDDTVEFEVRRRDPFLRWVLSFAGDAVVVAPTTYRREYAALVERTLQQAKECLT